jgi:hypothetical protein
MEAVVLKHPYYTKALWRKINENWRPRVQGSLRRREVLVVFTISGRHRQRAWNRTEFRRYIL